MRGGREEQEKFGGWYARTLASYEHFFGAVPPSDIWPAPQTLVHQEANFRRVNLARYALVPCLPHWFRRLAPAAALVLIGFPLAAQGAQHFRLEWTRLPRVLCARCAGGGGVRHRVPIVSCRTALRGLKPKRKIPRPMRPPIWLAGPQGACGPAPGVLVSTNAVEYRKPSVVASRGATLHIGQPTDASLRCNRKAPCESRRNPGSPCLCLRARCSPSPSRFAPPSNSVD